MKTKKNLKTKKNTSKVNSDKKNSLPFFIIFFLFIAVGLIVIQLVSGKAFFKPKARDRAIPTRLLELISVYPTISPKVKPKNRPSPTQRPIRYPFNSPTIPLEPPTDR